MKRLLLAIPFLVFQNAYLRLRLRRFGIEPDALPEIHELRRRFERGESLRDNDSRPEETRRDQGHPREAYRVGPVRTAL